MSKPLEPVKRTRQPRVEQSPASAVSYGRGEDVVTLPTSLGPDRPVRPAAPDRLRLGLRWLGWLVVLLALQSGLARAAERLLPLGPAEVSEVAGAAWTRKIGSERRKIQKGERITDWPWIETEPGARLELRFADGTLIRLGERTKVTLFPVERRVWLSQGKVLVVGDRMAGGLAVLSELAALLPEGTSYLVEATPKADGKTLGKLTVTVVEGAVCACAVAGDAPGGSRPTRDAMVLPGEQMTVVDLFRRPSPKTVSLAAIVTQEPLWVGFASKLPNSRAVTESLSEQRRGILAGRNARLRREIFWKRPAHPPVPPLKQFVEPGRAPSVRYDFPE